MMNEIGEYKQYTVSLDSPANFKNHRLKYYTLIKNSFAGLERALTIIARQQIFGDSDEPKGFNVDLVKDCLRSWCGFKTVGSETRIPPDLKDWLPNYIRKNFLQECINGLAKQELSDQSLYTEFLGILDNLSKEKDVEQMKIILKELKNFQDKNKGKSWTDDFKTETERIKKIIEKLDELALRAALFDKGLFTVRVDDANTFRAINYDRVIANALLLGKLRNYCLKSTESFDVRKFTDKKASGKKVSKGQLDMVLKITAFYLLQKKFSDQRFVPFNNLNMLNWLSTQTKPEKWELEEYRFCVKSDNAENSSWEPIFEFQNLTGKLKLKKISLHEEWLKKFQLIKYKDSDDLKRCSYDPNKGEQIFYSNTGGSEALQAFKR